MGEEEKMKTGKKCVSFSCFVAKTAHCSFVLITEGVKRKKNLFHPHTAVQPVLSRAGRRVISVRNE